jgi:flagellar hook-basal body complex protein FliE
MRIGPNPAVALGVQGPEKPKVQTSDDFGQTLMDVLKEVNAIQADSRKIQTDFMTGQAGVEYHDLMIAMEKASVAMQLTLQVRNKLLEAYQEINRIQI